jgi:nucleoside-diphosphate-sugar epimerase
LWGITAPEVNSTNDVLSRLKVLDVITLAPAPPTPNAPLHHHNMSKSTRYVLLGGHGKVALQITRIATQSPYNWQIDSIHRSPAHDKDIQDVGGNPITLDIEKSSTDELVEKFKGADGIIWSAGAGGKGGKERTWAVDYDGAVKAYDAAQQAGVRRFVVVSAIDVRNRDKPPPEWYTKEDIALSDRMWKAIPEYMKAKLAAEEDLYKRAGKLDWTVVRPSGLTDEPGTGKVALGKAPLGTISREDVARVVIGVVDEKGTIGKALDLSSGDTPIEEAIKRVVS